MVSALGGARRDPGKLPHPCWRGHGNACPTAGSFASSPLARPY